MSDTTTFDPTTKLSNLDGSPRLRPRTYLDGDEYSTKAVSETVGFFAQQALAETNDECDIAHKLKRQDLALKLFVAEEEGQTVELQTREVDEIKALVGKAYPPLIMSQVYKALDAHTENGNGKPEA